MKAITLCLLLLAGAAQAAAPVQRIQQMVDYLGVDYRDAVAKGQITNASEYAEMLDFSRTLVTLAKELPDAPGRDEIRARLQQLETLVTERAEPAKVAALTAELRRLLIFGYGLSVVPVQAPDLQRGARLYSENCAACHGAEGRGDGPLAVGLDPRPTDFTDLERYRERTLYGLYSTITHGLEGTAMPSWSHLPQTDRWDLAFYVGGLGAAALAPAAPEQIQGIDGGALTTRTPAEMEALAGAQGGRQMAWLRLHPESLWHGGKGAAIAYAQGKLEESRQAYLQGDVQRAHDLAVSAYLEGFEMVEGNLDALNADLRHQVEAQMTRYRGLIDRGVSTPELNRQVDHLQALLRQAGDELGGNLLSAEAAFTAAVLILLREGLEAILVLAALAAFLLKTGRRDGLRYLYYGTGAALALGLLTWFVSAHLVAIGGAGRELTEALAALFAALMLFVVGFWLHSKSSAAQWRSFIQDKVQKALSKETLWGLAALAFVAVYREIFETVLFYQALWLQTGTDGQGMILTGLVAAAATLVLVAWGILHFSARLPLRQFFAVTGAFMFVLAVIFAGKGIAALQEVGLLSSRPVDFPRIELLGVYPNLEGLMVQSVLVILAAALLWRNARKTAHP